eukprot:14319875-Heterocapsa_arctica.AAC.2
MVPAPRRTGSPSAVMSCEMRDFVYPRSFSALRMLGVAMPRRRRSSTRVREGAPPEVGGRSSAAAAWPLVKRKRVRGAAETLAARLVAMTLRGRLG